MGSSQPNSSRHSSCKIHLAFSMTGAANPSGSKTALTWERTPLLVSGLSFKFTSFENYLFQSSTLHQVLDVECSWLLLNLNKPLFASPKQSLILPDHCCLAILLD